MPRTELIRSIETALDCKISTSKPLAVGFGLLGLTIKTSDGRKAAVKASRTKAGNLETEAFMLNELRHKTALPIPEVYYRSDTLLVMEWIEGNGSLNKKAQYHAAELLSQLHSKEYKQCGYSKDTLIGPLHQPNDTEKSWIEFFKRKRLLYMASEARLEGSLPAPIYNRLEKLADRLEQLLTEPHHPALLHDDLWSGNIIVGKDNIAGLIDPAIYCGHPEIELAFTTLFSTFGQDFFEAYHNLTPIEPGFHSDRAAL